MFFKVKAITKPLSIWLPDMLILEIKKVQSEVIDVHIVSASNSFIVTIMLE